MRECRCRFTQERVVLRNDAITTRAVIDAFISRPDKLDKGLVDSVVRMVASINERTRELLAR